MFTATNTHPAGGLTITGTPAQGQTLTAANTLEDADGINSISYQWYADGVAIDGAGATSDFLMLNESEVGKAITVRGSYTDLGGTAESVLSTGTEHVANTNDAPAGSVTITGALKQGETLTAHNTITDADGMGSISYLWYADGVAIDSAGATSETVVLSSAELGKVITVRAAYTDLHGTAEGVNSNPTAIVLPGNEPPMGDVTIRGTARQGETLTAHNDITDADGMGAISYLWYADGAAIAGASADTLVLTEAQVGKAITVHASYTDAHGTQERVASSTTTTVENVNDPPTGNVTISGTPAQAHTLSASNTLGDIDGLGTIHYQWYADGAAITGATDDRLLLTEAQISKMISVHASYTDAHGTQESITSNATGLVTTLDGNLAFGGGVDPYAESGAHSGGIPEGAIFVGAGAVGLLAILYL